MKKVILLFLIFLISFSLAQEFYPTTIGELTSEVKLHGTGNIKDLKIGQEVTFETLTFQESNFQNIEIITEVLHINGKDIFPEHIFDEFGNKYVKFTITENGNFDYELIAKVNTKALVKKIDDYNINGFPENVELFTKSSPNVESDSDEILTVTKNKLISKSFIENLNKTIFWVNEYVEYASDEEFQRYYLLQESAIDTLINKKGVCDEFANLGAAILRARGIPTRLAIGITFDGREWGNHAWIEVYHNKSKWIPSDPTFRESGFVDATHIKLGSFSDVSLSLAKAIYPQGTQVTFQTQTLPEIKVLDKKYFSHAKISVEKTQLKTNQWNEINVNVKNNTNGRLTIPLKISQNYNELKFDAKTKSIILNENEDGIVTFNVFPELNLNENQIASGNLTINSLATPYDLNFEIIFGKEKNGGEITVNDVTAIAFGDKLRLVITIANNSSNEEEATIIVNEENTWIETLNPFENRQITKNLPLENKEYLLKVITHSEKYTQKIIPSINTLLEPEKELIETVIVQKVNEENEEKKDEDVFNNPIMWVFAILPIVAIGILIIIATKKKYM